jgi:hypothetical protein
LLVVCLERENLERKTIVKESLEGVRRKEGVSAERGLCLLKKRIIGG